MRASISLSSSGETRSVLLIRPIQGLPLYGLRRLYVGAMVNYYRMVDGGL